MALIVYDKNGAAKCELRKWEYSGEFMGECYVTASVESPTPIDFQFGDYIIYRNERFEINYDPSVTKQARPKTYGAAFKYDDVKFNSLSDELTRCLFLDYVSSDNNIHYTSLPSFSFYCETISALAERIQANLDRLYTGENAWTVVVNEEYVEEDDKTISVNSITCWEALALVNSEFDASFIIRGRVITIGTAGTALEYNFEYGKGKGLKDLSAKVDDNEAVITRLRAYGNTTNMPARYYNKITNTDGEQVVADNMAITRLMLPCFPKYPLSLRNQLYSNDALDPYLESVNASEIGIREGSVYFDGSDDLDDIYPSIEGMTAEQLVAAGYSVKSTGELDVVVEAEQITDTGVFEDDDDVSNFDLTIKDIGFNINDYLSSSEATISFKDGMCGGREFTIHKCTKNSDGTYNLNCVRDEDGDLDMYFPNCYYNIQAGDKFVLLNIEMPDVYIDAASERLLEAAEEYLAENEYVRYNYTPTVDKVFMARQHLAALESGGVSFHDTIKEGDLMLFSDDDLNMSGSVFIDKLIIKEGNGMIPEYEVTLREEKTVGTVQRLQNQIDSVSEGVRGITAYTAQQIQGMIAAYGVKYFLSKVNADTAAGFVEFAKGLKSDEMMELVKGFKSTNYALGASGALLSVNSTSGESYLEVDKLYVRLKAYFDSLEIRETTCVGGREILSAGGAVRIYAVYTADTVEEMWKYLVTEDGEEDTYIVTEDGEDISLNSGQSELLSIPEDVYRCYFLAEQEGVVVTNPFVVGDLLRSQNFNVAQGTHTQSASGYYWRKCVGVGSNVTFNHSGEEKTLHYVDLSISDCDEGSDEPMEGDVIAQLGNTSGDKTRENALVFSAVDEFSPAITLYEGIDDYTLTDKEIIQMAVDSTTNEPFMHVYGSMYIGDKSVDGTAESYLEYSPADKLLKVKGEVTILPNSTVVESDGTTYTLAEKITNFGETIASLAADNEVSSWFYACAPSLTNQPAANWTTDELKAEHVGDLYYDTDELVAYAWQLVTQEDSTTDYAWVQVDDDNILGVLKTASESLDTAIDNTRKVFLTRPTKEQSCGVGDLWVNAVYPTVSEDGVDEADEGNVYNGVILVCLTGKQQGEVFNIDCWSSADTYAAKVESDVAHIKKSFATSEEAEQTSLSGGLILSSAIALGSSAVGAEEDTYWTEWKVRAGMNGNSEDSDIAMWWGGEPTDLRDYGYDNTDLEAAGKSYATGAIRFDGSGYLASGNIRWDEQGDTEVCGVVSATTFADVANTVTDGEHIIDGSVVWITDDENDREIKLPTTAGAGKVLRVTIIHLTLDAGGEYGCTLRVGDSDNDGILYTGDGTLLKEAGYSSANYIVVLTSVLLSYDRAMKFTLYGNCTASSVTWFVSGSKLFTDDYTMLPL